MMLAVMLMAAVFNAAPLHAETRLLYRCDDGNRQVSLVSWPATDFSRCTVLLDEVFSGGPGKDGIPAIDKVQVVETAME